MLTQTVNSHSSSADGGLPPGLSALRNEPRDTVAVTAQAIAVFTGATTACGKQLVSISQGVPGSLGVSQIQLQSTQALKVSIHFLSCYNNPLLPTFNSMLMEITEEK